MSELTCKDCQHFRQHYRPSGNTYTPIGCGHCVYPRLKHRHPDTEACFRFVPAVSPESAPPDNIDR